MRLLDWFRKQEHKPMEFEFGIGLDNEDNIYINVDWAKCDEELAKKIAVIINLLEQGSFKRMIDDAISTNLQKPYDKMMSDMIMNFLNSNAYRQSSVNENTVIIKPSDALNIKRFVRNDESESE